MGWTSITADTSWQDAAVARQCVIAWNDRLDAMSETERTTAGVDFMSELIGEADEVFDVVYALQDGIEKIATCFANATSALTGTTSYPASFASVAAMMTAAGLTQSGYWRRIAEGGTQPGSWTSYTATGWSYGKITDKDLAGPWLWIDIQTALTALKRRVFNLGTPTQEGDTVVATGSGSAPTLPAIEYAASGASSGMYSLQKSKGYGENPTALWEVFGLSVYFDYTLTSLSSQNKTVRLLGKVLCMVAKDTSDTWTTGFGVYPNEPTSVAEGDRTVRVLSSSTTTDTSVTLRDLPALTAWSQIANYIPWPATPPSPNSKYNKELLQTFAGKFCVDYAFDP